jgi:hypothetical protein
MSWAKLNKWESEENVKAGVKNENYVITRSKFIPAEHFPQASFILFHAEGLVGMEIYLTPRGTYLALFELHSRRQNIYLGLNRFNHLCYRVSS